MKRNLKLNDKRIIQWLIIFCTITVVTFSLIGDKGFFQLNALKEQEKKLEQEIQDLKQEKKEWLYKIQSLKNNRSYFETIAREKLGMVRNDEIVIHLEFKDEN